LATIEAVRNEPLTDRLAELARENEQLQSQVAQLTVERAVHRALVVVASDETLEVWCDPTVRVATTCLPETRTNEEFAEACQWTLAQVPARFRELVDDVNVRPTLYSARCLSVAEWRLFRDRRAADKYLESIERVVDEAIHNKTSAAQPASGENSAGFPF